MPPPWKAMRETTSTSSSAETSTTNGFAQQETTNEPAPSPWMSKMQNLQNGGETSSSANENTKFGSGFSSNNKFGSSSFASSGGSKSKKVKITFWPSVATEDDLRSIFSGAGDLTRVRILPPRDGRDTTLCFVEYSTEAEAEAAVNQCNNHEIEGRRLRVQLDDDKGQGSNPSRSNGGAKTTGFTSGFNLNSSSNGTSLGQASAQIRITFLPSTVSEDYLRGIFSAAGAIKRIRILPPRDGRDITLGFVTFQSSVEAEEAVELYNNHEIEGKRIRVQIDENAANKDSSSSSAGRGFGFVNGSTEPQGNQVKVFSCPASISKDDLMSLFATAGSIDNVRILPPRDNADVTLGFVTFSDNEGAASAVEKFNNYEVEGKCLRVVIDDRNSSRKQRDAKPSGWGAAASNGGSDSAPASRPWGNSTDSGSSSKPWGSTAGKDTFGTQPEGAGRSFGFKENGFSGRSREESGGGGAGGGIVIEDGELNENFSLNSRAGGRAPVIYVPPPPPENESEIFDDTCHQGINFSKYENIPVEVTGNNPPGKVMSFQEADLHAICRENIKRSKFEKPTPVQKYALPVVLAGRDFMACAQTGSGKTAAYLLPIVSMLLKNGVTEASVGETASPNVLVIVPTRELAVQIFQEARKFCFGSQLQTVVIYGGVSVSHQLGKLYDGCNILVATPGRLQDFVERGRISLSSIDYLVLDEADRMLDMGFGPTIHNIIDSSGMTLKDRRQTLMLSATFPESIQRLAANYLKDYLFITVGRVGGASTDIIQAILEIQGSEKRSKLEEILLESGTERTLVFVETKRSADFLATFLSQRNFPTTSISSDRTQEERECALRDFRTGRAPVLVATAVAARGLDIPDVKHVVNYDLPTDIDEYVHRIGRTGRIGNQGRATSFFDRNRDVKLARGLVKVFSESSQEVPDWLEEAALLAVGTGYGPKGGQFSSRDNRRNNKEFRKTGSNDSQNDKRNFNVDNSKQQWQVDKMAAGSQDTAQVNDADNDMWC